jgi:hypothetical protein
LHELKNLGARAGLSKFLAALGRSVPVRLVRLALQAFKTRWGRWRRRRAERARVHHFVGGRDVVWSMDATHLGRAAEAAVQCETIRDVGTTALVHVSLGAPASANEAIAALERARVERGGLPLVLASDNGLYASEAFECYLARSSVVHLRSLPRVPQHNPWAEHAHGELKGETGLGRNTQLEPLEAPRIEIDRHGAVRGQLCFGFSRSSCCRAVTKAVQRLNHGCARSTRNDRTAAQLDRILPRGDDLVRRESFHRAALENVALAVHDTTSRRARRAAQREAILCTMEDFGLLRRTRGRWPQPGAKAERDS